MYYVVVSFTSTVSREIKSSVKDACHRNEWERQSQQQQYYSREASTILLQMALWRINNYVESVLVHESKKDVR